ncbi:MAG TPA: prepilin-type N-terminal cleavage/methylation domain-containing protein [Candidatus Saccharimonadales bacterium]|nr:prepilin-type N-terminal cleavage/methylation domain-containing protein [Candidatus Saccharimonadales bacterium]
MKTKRLSFKSAGFTIVELMIASVVFSLVLVLITYGVIRFNQAYYGGVVQTATQNVARSVIDSVTQGIQLNGGEVAQLTPVAGWSGVCVGNQFYQFQQGKQLYKGTASPGPNQVSQAMILEPDVSSCSGQTPGATVKGTEMLGEHMRLANLTVSSISGTSLYKVNVRVVYGDDELLCAQSVSGSCSSPSSTAGATATDAQCKSGTGTPQFCAVSDLSTTVQKRIN